jgi:hypothetical protein
VNWLAVLLSLAAIGGSPAPHVAKPKPRCAAHAKHCKHKHKPKSPTTKVTPRATPAPDAPGAPSAPTAPRSSPSATPTPTPTATPTPAPGATPTPTATPTYPKRTGVDLVEWDVRSSYQTLAAGRVTFNVTDLGEDDHNLSVRGGGKEYGGIDLHPGDADSLVLTLPAGTYTLYCNIPTHEELGMRTDITVR